MTAVLWFLILYSAGVTIATVFVHCTNQDLTAENISLRGRNGGTE